LCKALALNPSAPDILEIIKDPVKVPMSLLTDVISSGKLGKDETFRPSSDGTFLPPSLDHMKWQRSGEFGNRLKEKGLRSVVIGEVSDEWFGYGLTHQIDTVAEVGPYLERYYPEEIVNGMLKHYNVKPGGKDEQRKAMRLMGRALSDGQVYLPVRILHRDLCQAGIPVLRYDIRWTPDQIRTQTKGYIPHGSDRVIWGYLERYLTEEQRSGIGNWLDICADELKRLESGASYRTPRDVLTLKSDLTVGWVKDRKWDEMMNQLRLIVPGEMEEVGFLSRL